MSLKKFHLIFVLACMMAADQFGAWGVWQYAQYRNFPILLLGIACFVASFGIIVYGAWFLHKMKQAHL